MQCELCHAEATFNHPANYCDHHWALWWAEEYEDLTERQAAYLEVLTWIQQECMTRRSQ